MAQLVQQRLFIGTEVILTGREQPRLETVVEFRTEFPVVKRLDFGGAVAEQALEGLPKPMPFGLWKRKEKGYGIEAMIAPNAPVNIAAKFDSDQAARDR